MTLIEKLGLKALHCFDPETAHGLALKALQTPFTPLPGPITSDRLRVNVASLDLPNPVGLAAGFDKNAEVLGPLAKSGFGFCEVGAITPRPQVGNPKPRLFRLTEDKAVINRFGFNNEGMEVVLPRLANRPKDMVLGLNLGANKDSTDRAADFATLIRHCGPHLDFATVNVSSPNTEKLRDLQGKDALSALIQGVLDARGGSDLPVFLKIAPDLDQSGLEDIAEVALTSGISAVISTNTTLSRDGLTSNHKNEAGGMSGAPLFEKSTRALAQLSELTEGKIPLIGVGGISTAQQALDKIEAGAAAVQLYSALVYNGFSLGADIARDLDALLAAKGYASVSDAVGQNRSAWL